MLSKPKNRIHYCDPSFGAVGGLLLRLQVPPASKRLGPSKTVFFRLPFKLKDVSTNEAFISVL